jgi:ferredoxin
MRRFLFALFLFAITTLVIPTVTQAVRYAQCDECGLCKDTVKSNAATDGTSYYVKPDRWQQCFECLYPEYVLNPGLHVGCSQDELERIPKFRDVEGNNVPLPHYCDTLVMTPFTATPPIYPTPANEPTIVPQSGRVFSDLGCISVDPANHSFSDPNASVDVIQVLLDLVMSATGAVGTVLVMASATRLILSKGDPEKIREAKKTLTNVVLGLFFTLFGLFIFRFFAAQVLRIPGFN